MPNRFLAWGVAEPPPRLRRRTDGRVPRTGFPYTVIDQEQRVVGTRNEGGRFPNLFTLDLAVTKDVQITKTKQVRLGVQTFNLTNHFNPRDVQNNADATAYRPVRQQRRPPDPDKFTFLF